MKNILTTFIISTSLATILLATPQQTAAQTQTSDQRTTSTRIADLLARMPAANKKDLQTNLQNTTALGEDGLTEMALMLTPPGAGDNTRVEYALTGYSYYSTNKGNEALRAAATRAYCKALTKTTDGECKAYLIRQLEITGTDEAIPYLKPYLSDQRLCDPAARTLVKINTPSSGLTLFEALQNASGRNSAILIQALGDLRYTAAAATLNKLAANPATTKDIKAVYYTLGRIGDPTSESILAKAAASAAFKYDINGATLAYIDYIRQLAATNNTTLGDKAARNLLVRTNTTTSLPAHTAALKLLVEIEGVKSLPLLLAAVDDKDASYREAALKNSLLLPGDASASEWTKKLKVAKNATIKAAIITMLGKRREISTLPTILSFLKDRNDSVRLSAIGAAGLIGQDKSLPSLLEVLKKGSPADIAEVKKALLIMKGPQVADGVAAALPSVSGPAKAALVDVLAARAADNHINEILPLINSNDPAIRRSAFTALRPMATTTMLPQLFTLLQSQSDPAEISDVQQAIITASAGIKDTTERTTRILTEMRHAPADKQTRYYDILAGLPAASAAAPLFRIASEAGNTAQLDAALKGYIQLISHSHFSDDQRLLMLRNAMDIAKTTAQQQAILDQVQHCHTFPALVFAGKYLDDPALQQPAALAVMDIANSNKEWNGPVIRSLLEKTLTVLKGADADYQKQAIHKYLTEMPAGQGIVPLFNGQDLTGWKGLVENPVKRSQMDAATLQQAQTKADEAMRKSWSAKNGNLEFSGSGENLCTVKKYGDFEMFVDWKIDPDGDAGIYLRGSPQVQIWDTSRHDVGAQVGSGGLYNNSVYPSKPLVLADNAIGDWNTFHIIMKGDRVTVWLNGQLVVNNIILENYWDRKQPIFPTEQIELQAHGRHVGYRDLYIREFPRPEPYVLSEDEKKEGFQLLFDGTNMYQWMGNTTEYTIEDDAIAVHPKGGNHGNLYTKDEYQDFVYRFEFKLTPGANNGIGIRSPLEGDAAYVGMEIQVLDSEADIYRNLHEYQYHGSVYGVIPAKRGFLKPTGEWNTEEITAIGNHIKVVLNGTTILDGDITDAIQHGTLDHKDHPGLKNVKGHLGFLGHGDVVMFRHMRIHDLNTKK